MINYLYPRVRDCFKMEIGRSEDKTRKCKYITGLYNSKVYKRQNFLKDGTCICEYGGGKCVCSCVHTHVYD